jgi:CBS domain-containing protein
MAEMKKASELMLPLEVYPHVPYWFTLRQTVAVMEKAECPDRRGRPIGTRYVLVFNETYTLLGIVRRRDLLRGLDPSFSGSSDDQTRLSSSSRPRHAVVSSWDVLAQDLHTKAEFPVSQVMRPIHTTVDYDDHLLKVASKMVEQNVSMLPVLRENVVVGVIRSEEVFEEIASLIL